MMRTLLTTLAVGILAGCAPAEEAPPTKPAVTAAAAQAKPAAVKKHTKPARDASKFDSAAALAKMRADAERSGSPVLQGMVAMIAGGTAQHPQPMISLCDPMDRSIQCAAKVFKETCGDPAIGSRTDDIRCRQVKRGVFDDLPEQQ